MADLSRNQIASTVYFVVGRGTEGGASSSYKLSHAGVASSGFSLGTMQLDLGQRGRVVESFIAKLCNRLAYLTLVVLISKSLHAQGGPQREYPHLCKENELVAFTCMAEGKNISLCLTDWPQTPIYDYQCSTENYGGIDLPPAPPECHWNFKNWNKGHMIYRFGTVAQFGTQTHTELEYPAIPTPLKKAFGAARLVPEDWSGKRGDGLGVIATNRKNSVVNFFTKTGVYLLPGIYTEFWFSRGDYTYTIFDQIVSPTNSKTSTAAGVVVERNKKRLKSFICDKSESATAGDIYQSDGFHNGFSKYQDDIIFLFHGRSNFIRESEGFRGIFSLSNRK